MPDNIENKKPVVEVVRRQIRILNGIVLLVVYALLFLIVRFLYLFLDYISTPSLVTILSIIAGLMIMGMYVANSTSKKAIRIIDEYTQEIEICHMQQMKRAAKLASLGEIISGIAHEIKNPLTGISCAVQVFNSELSDDDSRKPVITEALNQVNRLDRIVKDLLSYAKPKPPMFVHSRISETLEKALFFVYPEAKKQNIEIDNQIGNDMPEMLMDPDQMHQVFLNIIINAIQSMPDGGVLTISASRKSRQEVEDKINKTIQCDKVLIVRIQDTGKGISSEDLPYLFEPFFTMKTQGTGLGLSISRNIVQEHGGEITVESEVGKGSAFTVYLPMKDR